MKTKFMPIRELLKYKGKTHGKPTLYKNTGIRFKRKYGIELQGAPIIFMKHNMIWKLSHREYFYPATGKTHETAEYSPVVELSAQFGAFDDLVRDDIRTVWDKA